MENTLIKISYINGLEEIVSDEISKYSELTVVEATSEEAFLEVPENLKSVLDLKSILNAYLVRRGSIINPKYLSQHKSILGNIVQNVLLQNPKLFTSFTISCAGSDSEQIKSIKTYLSTTFKLQEDLINPDLKIALGKDRDIWELSVGLTPRPLSNREYRISNIKGGINPTIAYAMNHFCNLEKIDSYLNICSGSATLLIEAGLENKNLKLQGFDIDGKTNALAIENIKKAGLIKSIHLKTADILDRPDLGTFDAITADLPFGMRISKGHDLDLLYKNFVLYCQDTLTENGTLVVYTTGDELFRKALENSRFQITKTIHLKIITSVNSFLYPGIYICSLIK